MKAIAVVFFLGGPVLGLFAGLSARGVEDRAAYKEIAELASERAAILKRETFLIAESLYQIRAFFITSGSVSRDQFRALTQELLARHPAIAAVEWIPRVTAAQRMAHEHETRRGGIGEYRIWARGPSGETVPAPPKADYYPIHYIEPSERGRRVLGLDLSLDPARRMVLQQSIQGNELALTDPINLAQESRPSRGFLALLPLYEKSQAGPAALASAPRGLIGIVIRAREVVSHAMGTPDQDADPELSFELIDENVNGKPVVIVSSGDADGARRFLPQAFSVPMELGGQRWRLSARASPNFLSRYHTLRPVAVGTAVFVIWELLFGLGLALTRRAHHSALRKQGLVYESALRSSSEGVVVAGADGRFLLFNPAAERILGLGMQDVSLPGWSAAYGCYLPDMVTPFPPEALPLARALKGEKSVEEIFIRNPAVPGGVWISSSAAPLLDRRGSCVGGVVTLRDISAWKEASESLKSSVKELKDLKYAVDQAAIVAITGLDGTIQYVNGKFCEISGYADSELLGRDHGILNSGYHPAAFFQELWKTIGSGAIWRGMMRNRAKDGSHYWVDTTIVPLLNHSGECDRYLAISTDVTASRGQEQNLLLLSSAVEQTADAVFITDAAGLISYVNPAFESMTGFSRHDALGKTPRILKSGTNDRRYYEELWRTILGGGSFRSRTINRKKSGALFEVEQTITPIRDSEGRIAYFVSVVKDITDRVMRQRQELEMRYAAQVQRQLYPAQALNIQGYDVAGASFAAESACGDYYDYLQPQDGSLYLILGDVSGHGLAPAMIMTAARSYLHFLVRAHTEVSEIMKSVNDVLFADLERSRFVALLLARIDLVSRRLVFVNAGLSDGFVLDRNGSVKAVLSTCGPPLGLLQDVSYSTGPEVKLEGGDVIVLMTDGVVEARDPSDNFLDADGALAVVRANLHRPAEELVQALYDEVGRFSQGAPQLDDITAIVCKVCDADTPGRAALDGDVGLSSELRVR